MLVDVSGIWSLKFPRMSINTNDVERHLRCLSAAVCGDDNVNRLSYKIQYQSYPTEVLGVCATLTSRGPVAWWREKTLTAWESFDVFIAVPELAQDFFLSLSPRLLTPQKPPTDARVMPLSQQSSGDVRRESFKSCPEPKFSKIKWLGIQGKWPRRKLPRSMVCSGFPAADSFYLCQEIIAPATEFPSKLPR
jgi:hypothetical protein